MQHSPILPGQTKDSPPLTAEETLMLQNEIARLQRENRALNIALAEMERVAQRDMLTPLYNRRYFLSALHQRLAKSSETGARSALIYIDVDGLKAINDRYGHAAGDIALIEVAARLSECARRGDVVSRIGGDEFGIIIDDVAHGEARAMMNHMRASLECEPVNVGEADLAISAAFGLTMLEVGRSAEEVMGQADADMYRSKREA